jgi:hypothetical protein
VSQNVGGDAFAAQARALTCRSLGVDGDAVLDRVAAEPLAAAAGEQRRVRVGDVFGEPGSEDVCGLGGERGDAVLAALAVAGDVCADAEMDVGDRQAGEFGDAQPGLDREQQQCAVAAPGPGVRVWARPAGR